jgi:RNAse (barnase) inhibitor barstar
VSNVDDTAMRVLRIDLADCGDKSSLLARIARALSFPDWFGHNWDALADCLDDLGWLPEGGLLLLLENTAELRAAAPGDYNVTLDILAEAAAAWRARGRLFEVAVAIDPTPRGQAQHEDAE